MRSLCPTVVLDLVHCNELKKLRGPRLGLKHHQLTRVPILLTKTRNVVGPHSIERNRAAVDLAGADAGCVGRSAIEH